MALKGIDVSHNNRVYDWQRAAADGVRFAMIRAALGSESGRLTVDTQFAANIKGAAAAGIAVGVYVYSAALTTAAAKLEAENLVALLVGYRELITWPVAYDIEMTAQARKDRRVINTEQAVAFCSVIRAAGYIPALYVNPAWMTDFINYDAVKNATRADLWLADWRRGKMPDSRAGMWQYEVRGTAADVKAGRATVVGSVDGVSVPIDVNISYKDYGEENMVRYKYAYECPDWAQDTLKKLDRKKYLTGKGDDKGLDLTEDMLRMLVVLDRAGAFGE
ncbi:MAG: GH25 family lysozyme [Clostridiaceae bacterium]|nr:GH25 family lysozyme [Clostridiaceae bacterium]